MWGRYPGLFACYAHQGRGVRQCRAGLGRIELDELQGQRHDRTEQGRAAPIGADPPLNRWTREPVHYEQPDHRQGTQNVQPIGQGADLRIVDLEKTETGQHQPGQQQHQTRDE